VFKNDFCLLQDVHILVAELEVVKNDLVEHLEERGQPVEEVQPELVEVHGVHRLPKQLAQLALDLKFIHREVVGQLFVDQNGV